MNRETSLYLDCVRILAALLVFFQHLAGERLTGGLFWRFEAFGQEAVCLFFVLSGFVIGFATDRRETSVKSYVIARLARIYSVALPALAFTWIFDSIGISHRPELYDFMLNCHAADLIRTILVSLIFANDFWSAHNPPGANGPYWSLSFEMWYYLIFGLAVFSTGWRRFCGVLLIAVVVGPKIITYLPLWLLGVGCYRVYCRQVIPPALGVVLFLAGPLLFFPLHSLFPDHLAIFTAFALSPHYVASVVYFYLVGIMFAANIIGFHAISPVFAAVFRLVGGPVRWIAGATFTMYLFHFPILLCLASLDPWPATSWPSRLLLVFGTIALVFLIAEIGERRKQHWRELFTQALARWPKAA